MNREPGRIGQDVRYATVGLKRVQKGMLTVGYDFVLTADDCDEIGTALTDKWGEKCRLPRDLKTLADAIRHLGGKRWREVTVDEATAALTMGGIHALRWYFDGEGAGVDTGQLEYENPRRLAGSAELVTAPNQQFMLRGYGPFFEDQLRQMKLPLDTGKSVDTL